jgi:hypothetical protein
MLYGYCRVSGDKQENGLGVQSARLEDYAKQAGLELFQPLFVDEDVTGSMPLKRRPNGQKLWDILRAGDVVVFTKLDRGFRNMADAATTLAILSELGVRMKILDLPMDLTTPEGSETMGHLKKQGRPYSTTRPYGWVRKGREWVPCEKERALGKKIVDWRDRGGSWLAIALDLCGAGERKPHQRKGSHGFYHPKDVMFLYRAAKAGYPKLGRSWWQAPDYERRLAAAISDGSLQSS